MPEPLAALRVEFRAPRNKEELRQHLQSQFGFDFPTIAQCPGHTAPFDAIAEAYFAEAPTAIWIASRGFGGKTHMLAGLSLEELITGYDVILAGGSGEQSRRAHEATEAAWGYEVKGPPDALQYTENGSMTSRGVSHKFLADEPRRTWTRTIFGNTMAAITASPKAARGPHPQRLRIDEGEECDITLVDAMMGQPLTDNELKPVQTVIASTHHKRGGTMDILLKRAKENGWPVHRWCYRDTLANPDNPGSWLLQVNVEKKRTEVSSRMWRIEYDLEPPADEDAPMFRRETILKLFERRPMLQDPLGAYIELEKPDPEGRYVTSADWGRKTDLSVIATIRTDVQPTRLVAWARYFRQAWQRTIAQYNMQAKRYGAYNPRASKAIHDATGIGDVIAAYLDVANAQDFIITPASKAQMFLDWEVAVDKGEFSLPPFASLVEIIQELRASDLFGDGHPPDEIVALALSWQLAGGTYAKKHEGKVYRPRKVG